MFVVAYDVANILFIFDTGEKKQLFTRARVDEIGGDGQFFRRKAFEGSVGRMSKREPLKKRP